MRALLIACTVMFVVGLPLVWLAGGDTRLTLVSRGAEVYAEVQGTRVDLPDANTYPAAALALPGRDSLRVQPGEDSLYWQECGWPVVGVTCSLGDLLQSLRPRSEWTGYVGNGDSSLSLTMRGGRSPGLVPLGGPGSSGPALLARPERGSVSWWRTENGVPVEQLASSSYRASGVTTARDLLSELLLVGWAASLLAILAWGVSRLARAVDVRRQVVAQSRPAARSREPRLRFMRSRHAIPLTLFVAGTLIGAWAGLSVLQGIPHVQDEVAYIFQGKIFGLGRSWVPAPQAPEFFANAFIQFFDGRWFSKYPPGYPLLLTPALWAGVPWLVNALSAGVALAATYLAGAAMYGRHVARWAALFGLLSPWVIFMSGSYMSHATTMMWAALFLLALVQARRAAERQMLGKAARWGLFGGFAIGMAFITREWTALGIGLGAAVWAVADLIFLRAGRSPRLAAYVCIPLGFIPPLLVLLYENRQLTGDWLRLAQDLVGSYDRPGFGPGHGDATIGHTPGQGLYNGLVYLRTLATMFDGWPAPFALAPAALGLFAWVGERGLRRLWWDALLWLSAGGLLLAYFAWWSSTTVYGPRYWYEAMPFFLLMAGRGMDLLGRVAARAAEPAWRLRARWLVPGALFAVFALYTLTQGLPWQASVYRGYNDITPDAVARAESARLANALVFVAVEPSRPNRDYGKVFFANDPLLQGPVIYARDLGPEKNAQLASLYPGRQTYWLPLEGPPVAGVGPSGSP